LTSKDGKLQLSEPSNALKGSGLESPIPPFGGADHFDISVSRWLVFVAKDPTLNGAYHTKQNLYLLNLQGGKPTKLEIPGFNGATSGPVFSPDGTQIAFLSQREDGYESDKNQIFVIPALESLNEQRHLFKTDDGKGKWDRSPGSLIWSVDSKTLYAVADHLGKNTLFELSPTTISASGDEQLPKVLFDVGSVSGKLLKLDSVIH
jgi:dipeptidyl aminopeptidase/acylaminoacyl peptidase